METRPIRKRGGGRVLRLDAANVVFVIGALVASVVALQVSVAGAFRTKYPQLALAWAPFDADARAKLAANLTSSDRSPRANELAVDLARDALRRTPVSPVSLRALGQAEQGNTPASTSRASQLFKEAQRLSRRDRPTQLWLIEQSLRRSDIPSAMRGVDIVLRTSASDRESLFSFLITAAAANADFSGALKVRLLEKPEWAWPFVVFLISDGPDARQIVDLSSGVLDPADPEDMRAIRALVKRLSGMGEYAMAWNTLSNLGLKQRSALVDGDFEDVTGYEPFTWNLNDEGDFWAERDARPGGSGRVLRLVALSGRAGEVARQLVRLRPGAYRLQATAGDVPGDQSERPELRLRCADKGAERVLLSIKPASGGTTARDIEGRLVVPDECEFQWLSVIIAGEEDQSREAPWIDDVRLTPLNR